MTSVDAFVATINSTIINPLLALLFAVGVLVFIYGVVEFLLSINQGDNTKKEQGKQHMWQGLLGMLIMVSALSIFNLLANTLCNNSGLSHCKALPIQSSKT